MAKLNAWAGPAVPWTRTTYLALLALVVLWAVQLYATWAAWGNLTIDSGHEMYISALLAEGKRLYRDVWFGFGPAAPYLNSYLALRRAFECALLGRLAVGVRVGNISFPCWDAAVVLDRWLDRRGRDTGRSVSAFSLLLPSSVFIRRRVRLLCRVHFCVDCRSRVHVTWMAMDVRCRDSSSRSGAAPRNRSLV